MKLINIKIKKLKVASAVLIIACLSSLFVSCEKFVEIDAPQGELSSDNVFLYEETTESAIIGLYQLLGYSYNGTFTEARIEQYTGISGDEITTNHRNTDVGAIGDNNIEIDNLIVFNDLWTDSYNKLILVNPIIEGLRDNNVLSEDFRNQILGEALFFRAFFHFHLVNIFGDIPYANTSVIATLNTLSRMPTTEVYEHIIADLKEAQSLMADNYDHADGKRNRANKSAATALLARAYLYTEDWANAEIEATKVIENPTYILEPNLDDVFLKPTRESILQISINETRNQNGYAQTFVIGRFGSPFGGGSWSAYELTDQLFNSFETGDARFDHWVGIEDNSRGIFHYAHKYKKNSFFNRDAPVEELVFLRFAELFLIRAEARAQLEDISGSQEDVNMIRNRAGLENTTANTKATLLDAIAHERRIELMVEGGHRWYDLKRTGKVDAVVAPLKSMWEPTDVLFPIPIQEILNNTNLTQNPGY
jgi:hypothetical protein